LAESLAVHADACLVRAVYGPTRVGHRVRQSLVERLFSLKTVPLFVSLGGSDRFPIELFDRLRSLHKERFEGRSLPRQFA